MDLHESELAILSWLRTFQLGNIDSIAELFDGVGLVKVLSEIDPEFFQIPSSEGLSESYENRKMIDFKTIFTLLEKYYVKVLNKVFSKNCVNVERLVRNRDTQELGLLIELILGAAVLGKNKEKHISAILTLDETTQTALMLLIEKLLARHTTLDDQSEEVMIKDRDFNEYTACNSQLRLSHEDQVKQAKLLVKLEELEKENQSLNHRITELQEEKVTFLNKIDGLETEIFKKNHEIKFLIENRDTTAEREAQSELKVELDYKEKKITELSKFISELRMQQEASLSKLRDENENLKRKVAQMAKLETNLAYYKSQFEEQVQNTAKVHELETTLSVTEDKLKECEKTKDSLQEKVKKFKTMLEEEKEKNIKLEIDLTRKTAEAETFESEKQRLELNLADYEARLSDAHKQIEQLQYEREETARLHTSTERAMAQIAAASGADFNDIITNYESQARPSKEKENDCLKQAVQDEELEILQKENSLLKTRCIQTEKDNELLRSRLATSESLKNYEKMTQENEKLRVDNQNLRTTVDAAKKQCFELTKELAELKKEVQGSKKESIESQKMLNDNLNLKNRLTEVEEKLKKAGIEHESRIKELEEIAKSKTAKLDELGAKITDLERKNQKLQEQNDKKVAEIENIDSNCQAIYNADELAQKEEELKILATAMHELVIRNQELEKLLSGTPKKMTERTSFARGMQPLTLSRNKFY